MGGTTGGRRTQGIDPGHGSCLTARAQKGGKALIATEKPGPDEYLAGIARALVTHETDDCSATLMAAVHTYGWRGTQDGVLRIVRQCLPSRNLDR